jgi:hypothetical protein
MQPRVKYLLQWDDWTMIDDPRLISLITVIERWLLMMRNDTPPRRPF